jgi:hypothetical protein
LRFAEAQLVAATELLGPPRGAGDALAPRLGIVDRRRDAAVDLSKRWRRRGDQHDSRRDDDHRWTNAHDMLELHDDLRRDVGCRMCGRQPRPERLRAMRHQRPLPLPRVRRSYGACGT